MGYDEIIDWVKVFDVGVDDYLIKFFLIDELMVWLWVMYCCVEMFLGFVSGFDFNEIFKVVDFSMNICIWDVSCGDWVIWLLVKEYDLLNFLMWGVGRVFEC